MDEPGRPTSAAATGRHPDDTPVREVMRQSVHLVPLDTTVIAAARRMRDADVGCLPVGEGDRLIGMITDRDLVVRAIASGKDVNHATVRDVMSVEVLYCFDHQTVGEVAAIMATHQVRRLPVLNRRRKAVGIVSYGDLAGGSLRTRLHEVVFQRTVPDSSGHRHKVALATVYVTDGQSDDEVVAAAIHRFERDRGVGSWRDIADDYEVIGPR